MSLPLDDEAKLCREVVVARPGPASLGVLVRQRVHSLLYQYGAGMRSNARINPTPGVRPRCTS